MNTSAMKNEMPAAPRNDGPFAPSIRNPQSVIRSSPAFTLIELLVVISIIGLLAAFTMAGLMAVKRSQYRSHARAEMALIETAIDSYKAAYGFYPPGNPNSAIFNPLYFELLGTTNKNNATYQTLDGSASISDAAFVSLPNSPLGVGGFINCAKLGAGEDAPTAKNFLPGLKPKQFGLSITNPVNAVYPVALLLCSVGGPDQNYRPLNASDVNPWRYTSPGTNNPGGYDLYVQLVISGKTNLICNWSRQVQINSPLP